MIPYKPHKNQMKIHQDSRRFRIVVCGRRWGKTTLAVNELIRHALSNDDTVNWLVAPTYKQAKMIAWRMLHKFIPKEFVLKRNETELSVQLNNGSIIELRGADNSDSLRGVGVHFLVCDEFATMKDVWEEILRPMLSDTMGKALFIGTPAGKNAFWELYMRGQKDDKDYKSWKFSTGDNPYIPRSEIAEAESQMAPRYFRQEYLANFEDYKGIVYPEHTEEDIIDPIDIPKEWRKIGSIDPAMTGITALLFGAVDYDGVIHIYDEYYQADKRVGEVVQRINQDSVQEWYIDPAAKGLKSVRDGIVYTLYNEFFDLGLRPFFGQNDVEGGINRVAEFFTKRKIKIFSTCKNLIWELERYHYAEERETVGGAVRPKPFKANDHLCDCLRYMVMSRAESPIGEPKIVIGTDEYYEKLEEEQTELRDRIEDLRA